MLLLGFVLWRLISKPCVMVLPLALVLLPFFSSSGDGFGDDGGDHGAAYTEDLEDLVDISFFLRVFCVRWLGQLSILYPTRMCMYEFVCVRLP